MVLTRDRIADALRQIGVRPGAVLMIHSSLRSLGHVVGGAATVVDALLEALGPSGTLVGPSFNYETAQAPGFVFDPLNTPSDMGAIADEIRRRAGNLRSRHLTHSVSAIGPQAEAIVTAGGLTAWDADSPLGTVFKLGGHFLLLGVTYDSFTACPRPRSGVSTPPPQDRHPAPAASPGRRFSHPISRAPSTYVMWAIPATTSMPSSARLWKTPVSPASRLWATPWPASSRPSPCATLLIPRVQRDPDYLLQQNSTNTPLSRGVTLTLPPRRPLRRRSASHLPARRPLIGSGAGRGLC